MSEILESPPLRQINLVNPSLIPARQYFSARSVAVWITISLLAMMAVAWWAVSETQKLRQKVVEQKALRAGGAEAQAGPTPQQMAAMEQSLRAKQATLETRRAVRDTMRRGMIGEGGGPSAMMRLVAASIPAQVWLTELRASGNRIEISGRSIDPAALNAWIAQLGESREFAAKPISTVRVENSDFSAAGAPAAAFARNARAGSLYTFSLSATLTHPFAEDGRAP